MAGSNDARLEKAYRAILDDHLLSAREILRPLTISDADNPHVWWLYAHAVEDPDLGREAISKVMDLDPDYPGITKFTDLVGAPAGARQAKGDPGDLPLEAGADRMSETAQAHRQRWMRLLFLVLALLGILLVLALLFFSTRGEPTVSENPPTLPATVADSVDDMTPGADETGNIGDGDALAVEPYAIITIALVDEGVRETTLVVRETGMGSTVLVKACGVPGPDSTSTILQIFDVIAGIRDQIALAPDALGVAIENCSDDFRRIRQIAVSYDQFEAYAQGELTASGFQGAWTALP
jgi:hypothetical protein